MSGLCEQVEEGQRRQSQELPRPIGNSAHPSNIDPLPQVGSLSCQKFCPLIQSLTSMQQLNYFVVPSASFPPFFYYSFPSFTSHQLPSPQIRTEPTIAVNTLVTTSSSSSLELTREDLLAAGYDKKKRVWSAEEDQKLLQLVGSQGVAWKDIESRMEDRTEKMCYSRYRRLLAEARQRWAPEEQRKLKNLVEEKGEEWKQFASEFPNRTWKQLRDKYVNYLRPDIKKDDWSLEEDQKILELLTVHGTKWKAIQQQMPDRTDNQIKNRYYGRLKILMKKKAKRRP